MDSPVGLLSVNGWFRGKGTLAETRLRRFVIALGSKASRFSSGFTADFTADFTTDYDSFYGEPMRYFPIWCGL